MKTLKNNNQTTIKHEQRRQRNHQLTAGKIRSRKIVLRHANFTRIMWLEGLTTVITDIATITTITGQQTVTLAPKNSSWKGYERINMDKQCHKFFRGSARSATCPE